MDAQLQSQRARGVGKPRAEAVGCGLTSHLGRRTHRHVDQDVGGARGYLLRQHAGHQLTVAVEIQRALHPDQDVVGRTRSEEHTSELQSLMRISYAVFCLKKKTVSCNTK